MGLGLLLVGPAQAQVILKVGIGVGATHATIGAALAAVPSPLTQPVEIELLNASYFEDVLITRRGTATNTLTIRPASGVSPVLTGTLTFGAGSAYVKVSGNNGSTPRALTLRQPSVLKPTVQFVGDASHNEVRETLVLGSNNSLIGGVVVVGNGASTGNDNNTIAQSFIGNADPAVLPANLVYAASASGVNDDFSLTNNQLFNFSRAGLLVTVGNGNRWNISGNSFYYNAAAVPLTAQTAIDFRPGITANDVTVANNFIGGRGPETVGGLWENAGIQTFRGIAMSVGTSASLTNEVSGNVVSGVSLTGVSSAALIALDVDAGRNELTDNTVSNVSNNGTSGVNSLVSRATATVLNSFSVSSGQLMVVEDGLTVVKGSLTNDGILNHTGGDMLIEGDFNNTGTFAQTLGDIEIKGDMNNSGVFSCTTGKVKLTGNGPQKVSGGLYFNLEVNGAGTKTFTGDAVVYSNVQMLNGILATGRYRIKLDRLANLNETNASYVLGKVEVERTPVVGTVEEFGGVGLELLSMVGSLLPGSTLVTRVTGTTPTGAGTSRGISRYFDIDATNSASLNLSMTIRYLPHELNGIAPANLRFFRSTNLGMSWQNRGVTASGTNFASLAAVSVLAGGATTASRWTLGDVTAPLPVGLTAFRAERQSRNAVLTWATASELDSRGFGVEVSLDGKTFREIGFVAPEGSGTSTAARSYRFVDAAEGKAGLRYYRLRQEDLNGKTAYYGPEVLNFNAAPVSLAAYPTQFAAELTVALTSPTATTATLRLVDAVGREVWHREQAVVPGAAPLRVQLTCAAGTYTLTATVAGQVLRQRVVKD
jgi:hypothetical protein